MAEDRQGDAATRGGAIAYMARNRVAANLLMIFILAAGLVASQTMVQEVFPAFSLDRIQVVVPYPGANPEEIEESVLRKIEEQIEAVEGVKEIRSTAYEGRGVVLVELQLGTDTARALDEVKAEVDRITTFPAQAERPEITELTNRQSVIRFALSGDTEVRTLKELAYRLEDELAALPEVSFVETSGVRDYEISIEITRERLRELGLSLPELAARVRAGSLELSAGNIETDEEVVRIRTMGRNLDQQAFEEIIVLARPDGTGLRLGDIATVVDGFAENVDLYNRFDGKPVAFVEVFRTSDERVLEIVDAVNAHIASDFRPGLPAAVELDVWLNRADMFESRLWLLAKNGAIGLVLVLVALTLFLNLRIAFWVAVGIGVSFVGTLAAMALLGISINQISLFAFILALGIVVDDAIVVGENVHAERERGREGVEAAVAGARRIARPVIFAVLTTMAAFVPLLFVPGTLGKILLGIPIVVICVLALSLIESLLVLPAHLSHLSLERKQTGLTGRVHRLQDRVDDALGRFVDGPLKTGLRFAVDAPSVVIASAIALIAVAVALVPAGILRLEFFPSIEGDVVTANLEMPVGTPLPITRQVAQRLEETGRAVGETLAGDRDDGSLPLVEHIYTVVGQRIGDEGPGGARIESGANLATIQFRLLDAEIREVSARRFEALWRERMGPVPEARSLTFVSEVVGAGPDVEYELTHPDPQVLDAMATRLREALERIEGSFDVRSDRDLGTEEIQLELKPLARRLGLTLADLARQVRAAFFGEEALRVQRGREEVRVYVRLPERQRDAIGEVAAFQVALPGGGHVRLDEVATASFGTSPSTIERRNGQRVIAVGAKLDSEVITADQVTAEVYDRILPDLRRDAPELDLLLAGEQEERAESNAALARGFALAMLVIYALLAIPFRSYVQPLVVMAAIPFGIIGAAVGHLLLGLPVGILSLFGIIGLSGVVVNDSLVMIDFVNERLADGEDIDQAIVAAAQDRFRPILLTSLTTFLSVAPLTFEQSLQAQFLIPMAASLGFGILFATVILMLLVPALAAVHLRAVRRLAG